MGRRRTEEPAELVIEDGEGEVTPVRRGRPKSVLAEAARNLEDAQRKLERAEIRAARTQEIAIRKASAARLAGDRAEYAHGDYEALVKVRDEARGILTEALS